MSLEKVPLPPADPVPEDWTPFGFGREAYLETIEGLCRFTARHQDERGRL